MSGWNGSLVRSVLLLDVDVDVDVGADVSVSARRMVWF
jgi:hypothetical protein